MVAAPVDTPVITPVAALTVTDAGLLLVHVPPVGVDASVVTVPAHNEVVPVIAVGAAFSVRPRAVETAVEALGTQLTTSLKYTVPTEEIVGRKEALVAPVILVNPVVGLVDDCHW